MSNSTTFIGGVFSDAIEGGRAGAAIELTRQGIVATIDDGDQFVLPYQECQLQVGGASDRMYFCRNADKSLTIFCEDRKFPAQLQIASFGILDRQLEQMGKKRSSLAWANRRLVTYILVGLLVCTVGTYFGLKVAVRSAAAALPVSVDKKIGDAVFSQGELNGAEVERPQTKAALEQMISRMAPHAAIEGMEFEVHIVKSEEINAFALPGGKMVVYTGLIDFADTPEQVAGVLGHEMAHATLRHGIERVAQSLGLAAAVHFIIGNAEGMIAAGAQLFQLATINSYSRNQESAADAEGVRMMHAAGLDPTSMPSFFEKLKQKEASLPGMAEWISTHPEHESRINALNHQIQSLPPIESKPLDIDWDAVKRELVQDRAKP